MKFCIKIKDTSRDIKIESRIEISNSLFLIKTEQRKIRKQLQD